MKRTNKACERVFIRECKTKRLMLKLEFDGVIDMKIREVNENKKQFIALLLLADEQENMFNHYLEIEYGKKSIGKPRYHFEQLKIK